jgi:hypothetical protein
MVCPTSFCNLGRWANKGFISISMLVGSECFYIGESPKFEILKKIVFGDGQSKRLINNNNNFEL